MEKIIKEGIKEFNRYRSPHATAKLLHLTKNSFEIQFKGPFVWSCCMDEYFLDLTHILKEKGLNMELKDFAQIREKKYVAKYSLNGSIN